MHLNKIKIAKQIQVFPTTTAVYQLTAHPSTVKHISNIVGGTCALLHCYIQLNVQWICTRENLDTFCIFH
jgi:hypothetical protein